MPRPLPPDPSHEARLEAVLESVSESFYAVDEDWRFVVFNGAAEAYFGVRREQLLGRNMWDLFPQGRGTEVGGYYRAAMDAGVSTTVELPSHVRPDRTVELKIVPMRGGGMAVTLTDVTERKEAEARRSLLINELNHRVRNSLATVQAIATQSLNGDEVTAAARDRFIARLLALAQANDVLVVENWASAGLMAIAAGVASPHGAGERFTIEGPPVRLSPQAATAMALALHELATNAAKYGALSAPAGHVSLSWDLTGDGEARSFSLVWRESGGPQVTPPAKSGFGTRLIERGLAGGLKAQVKLDYAPQGLQVTLTAPLGRSVSEG